MNFKNTLKPNLKHWLVTNKSFLLFVLIIFSVRWSLADHYRVPTGSMIPTIEIGDHVFVNKMAYDLKLPFTDWVITSTGTPQRGDIIVFKYPKDPSINYVKRLIALPGDEVDIQDGFVKINGQLTLKDPHLYLQLYDMAQNLQSPLSYKEQMGKRSFNVQRTPHTDKKNIRFKVPENQYFFMGDNRDNSSDSRYWGFVPRDYLKGKVKNVTISFTLNGLLPKINFYRFGQKII